MFGIFQIKITNNLIRHVLITSIVLSVLLSNPAFAYVGPGLGVGTIAAIGGVIFSVLLAIFAVIWYPLKRLIRSKKSKNITTFFDENKVVESDLSELETNKDEDD